MSDTLGLLEESLQLARDIGYQIREESLGELSGGPCLVGGIPQILLNRDQAPAGRLECLLRVLVEDPRAAALPTSRLLAARLKALKNAADR